MLITDSGERLGGAKSPRPSLYSFTDVEENTREQTQKARSHPWISQG